MSNVHFDNGESFIEDFRGLIKVAKKNTPATIVVASDREVDTFNRSFRENLISQGYEDITCVTFADFYISAKAPGTNVHIFRCDDIFKKICGMAEFKSMTVRGRKRINKEENK